MLVQLYDEHCHYIVAYCCHSDVDFIDFFYRYFGGYGSNIETLFFYVFVKHDVGSLTDDGVSVCSVVPWHFS